jgi:predicted Zn finger-like uncharacterized protein
MKIVCDNCATKYSIADEKVRGKVFKIRCKKCSHIIVVKGGEGATVDASAPVGSDSAETHAAEAPADGWHVVINGEQVGPLSPAEIRGKVQAGELDGETYAWREGFGDWQKLAAIDDFRDLVPAAPAPSADATKRSNSDDLFGNGADPGRNSGDLFGAPGGDLFSGGAAAPAAQSGGLFAQSEPAPSSKRSPTPGFGAPAMNAASESAPESGSKAMTGARSENSVLFSLNNLQALASGGGSQKASGGGGGGNGGVENRAGFANSQTEGSGLIDIRAMAAALSSSPSPMDSRSGDIPSFSSAPVFSPIAAPILMPAAPSGPPRWIWPVIGLGVLAVGVMITLTVIVLNKKPEIVATAPVAVAPPVPGGPVAAGAATSPTKGTAAAPTQGATVPTPAAPANTGNAASPAVAAAEHHSSKGSKGSKGSSSAPKAAKADSAPAPVADTAPTPAPAKPHKGKGDDLDDLLNGASPDKPSHAAREERAAPSDDNLPDQLGKNDIVGGMKKIGGKVGACFDQFKVPGLAMVAVTIGKSGRVQSASVSGAFSGTPTGDCVSRAVKSATFPQFKGASQSINYPFSLR